MPEFPPPPSPEALAAFFARAPFRDRTKRVVEGGIPEGTFFAGHDHLVETMTEKDVTAYAAFARMVIEQTPYYSDEDREESYAARTPEKIAEKLADPDWVLLTVKNEASDIIGSLEAKLIALGNKPVGNIKWTLTHPDYRRQGIATSLKLQFEQMLREREFVGIATGIKDDNAASIAMNLKMGYRVAEEMHADPGMKWYVKYFDE